MSEENKQYLIRRLQKVLEEREVDSTVNAEMTTDRQIEDLKERVKASS